MKIQFIQDHEGYKSGNVIGTTDGDGQRLIDAFIAVKVGDHIRPLKYENGQRIQTECFVPIMEELEAQPKFAVLPDYETATTTHKK